MDYRFCNKFWWHIFLIDHDLKKANNLELILSAFEQLSGLKINFYKNELICFGEAQKKAAQYVDFFGCEAGQFPIRSLDIPIHYRKLTNTEWKYVKERLQKRLAVGKEYCFMSVKDWSLLI